MNSILPLGLQERISGGECAKDLSLSQAVFCCAALRGLLFFLCCTFSLISSFPPLKLGISKFLSLFVPLCVHSTEHLLNISCMTAASWVFRAQQWAEKNIPVARGWTSQCWNRALWATTRCHCAPFSPPAG